MNENIVQLFHPDIQPYIKEVLRDGKVGICAGNIRVVDIFSGGTTLEKQPCCDRFKLIIPFAGQSISWEVVFNSHLPQFPPDFCFDDNTFLSDPDLETLEDHVPSLTHWDCQDPKALLHVIQELLALYRKHQVSLLDGYSRLQFEFTSLVCQTGVNEEDIEVQLGRKARSSAVNFLIRLPVDFHNLPSVLIGENPGEDSAVLLVTFHPPEGSKIIPHLYLSPRVEQALGGAANLHIPPFPSGRCLMDYVPVIMDLLQGKVEAVITGFQKKKDYISTFLSYFGRSVMEHDTKTFSKISFLFEWHDFYFIVHISLPLYFPQEKPIFVFQSIYHATYGKPFITKCDDYPYSPRWNMCEMAERAKTFILEYIELFQKNSIRSSQLC